MEEDIIEQLYDSFHFRCDVADEEDPIPNVVRLGFGYDSDGGVRLDLNHGDTRTREVEKVNLI